MIRRLSARLRTVDRGEAEAGFTIIEVMVAMMVFAIMAAAIAYGAVNALQLTQSSRGRDTAVALANQDIDQLRQTAAASTQGIFNVVSTTSSNQPTKTIGGVVYTISRVVNWVQTDGSSGTCGSSTDTSALAYKSVVETVSWGGARGNSLSTTVTSGIAPENAVTTPSNGTIAINAQTAAGNPNVGLPVTITPVSGGATALPAQPAPTDSQGCTYSTNVTPGTYKVTVNQVGGIDAKQNNPSTQSVTVLAGASTPVSVTYDTAANGVYTYGSNGATLATNMLTTLSSSPLQLQAMTTYPASAPPTSSTLVPDSLFPISAGYVAYAGSYSLSCADVSPTQWTTANAAGQLAAAPNPIVTSPGGIFAVNIRMGVAQVTVPSGQYITAVTSSVAPPGDPGCNTAMTLTFPQAKSGTQVIALPYGTWTLWSGTTSGAQTNNLIANKATVTVVTKGAVNTTAGTAWINTLTMDPRGQS